MKRVLIVGATSAIAQFTGRAFAAEGASLILAGRNVEKLNALRDDLLTRGAAEVATVCVDLDHQSRWKDFVDQVISASPQLDGVLIAHGQLPDQEACEQDADASLRTFQVNASSTIFLLTLLAMHFERQGSGCIAVISSVAGDRGRRRNYLYGSGKAAVDVFMQGLQNRLYECGVRVLTIKPGFVDTPMTAHLPKTLLFSSPEAVGKRIHRAMKDADGVVYIPFFWRWVMLGIRLIPHRIFRRLNI